MSASNSNLSNPKYSFDMVVAATQASVNATMEEWLSRHHGKPYSQAYVYNPTPSQGASNVAPIGFDKLQETVGFDPFDIPNGTATTDERIQKLMEQKFMFAFQVEVGLPDFPLSDIPPVISFNKEGSYVTYNMVCGTFKIIALQAGLYNQSTWLNLDQDEGDKPWVFSFTVDLNLDKDDINSHFHNLPVSTQQKIQSMGKDMFSIRQLYLDLNTAGLADSVKITNLETTSQAYVQLTTVFLNAYLAEMQKEGGVMLGYTVVADSHKDKSSLVPTNMNFEICSYKDQKNKATADYEAYTLNYLIMSENKAMPAPVQFPWNWVDKQNTAQYAGVMAINRSTFISYLHDLLSPTLSAISYKVKPHYHVNCVKGSMSASFEQDTAKHEYMVVSGGKDHVLTYSYKNSNTSSDSQYCGVFENWGNFGLTYQATSDVYLQGTQIKVLTLVDMKMHVNVEGGVSEGHWAKFLATTIYTVGVDTDGKLSVKRHMSETEDKSSSVKINGWSKFMSAGIIENAINSTKDQVKSWMKGVIQDDSKKIARMLNGAGSWVFPGGKTFSYTNAQFSDNQDLVCNILYKQPEV
ncbi:hypothetical protein AB9P05_17245 [Roseivirga sp. BDSF3-8]|uniref:hypothetical protein n=1 Tax=Roseivirga sp. BDSF3-8 TaxID=3241598 RepID=UPI00353224AB